MVFTLTGKENILEKNITVLPMTVKTPDLMATTKEESDLML